MKTKLVLLSTVLMFTTVNTHASESYDDAPVDTIARISNDSLPTRVAESPADDKNEKQDDSYTYVSVSALPTFNDHTLMGVSYTNLKETGFGVECGFNTALKKEYAFGAYMGITGSFQLYEGNKNSLFFTVMLSPLALHVFSSPKYNKKTGESESSTAVNMDFIFNPRLSLRCNKVIFSVGYFLMANKWKFKNPYRGDFTTFSVGVVI